MAQLTAFVHFTHSAHLGEGNALRRLAPAGGQKTGRDSMGGVLKRGQDLFIASQRCGQGNGDLRFVVELNDRRWQATSRC